MSSPHRVVHESITLQVVPPSAGVWLPRPCGAVGKFLMRYACHEGAGDLQAAENAPSENNSIHHLVRSYVSEGLAAILIQGPQ